MFRVALGKDYVLLFLDVVMYTHIDSLRLLPGFEAQRFSCHVL